MKKDSKKTGDSLAELAEVLTLAGDPILVKDFFYCLFTPAEIADIAARWALVKALDQKTPQREISRQLGISLCKITRGSRELRKPDSAFRKMLDIKKSREQVSGNK